MNPRIAIDARMAQHTGVGRYVRNLINALAARDDPWSYLVIANPTDDPTAVWDWLSVPEDKLPRIEVASFARPVPIYSLQEQAWLPKVITARGAALFHAPHFNIPIWSPVPVVATIHDVIYLSHPASAPGFLARRYAAWMLRKTARSAARVITVSAAAADAIAAALPLRREDLVVIPHSAEEMARWVGQVRRGGAAMINRRILDLPRFILAVGNHLPHKNLPALIAALAELKSLGFPRLVLALAGPRGRGTRAVESAARRLGVGEQVIILGEVADRDLAWLYNSAALLVHPSKAEGFGLPVLEAMAAGCPVVASDIPALRELGGDALNLCPPDKPEAFAAAIARLLLNSKVAEEAGRRGVERSRGFSFAEAAARTAAVYAEALGLEPSER